jgi:hypothetical protein
MQKLTTKIAIAALAMAVLTGNAFADRIYTSMEKCNRKCHGICFMEPDGARCHWGAMKKTAPKSTPKTVAPKGNDGKPAPRN